MHLRKNNFYCLCVLFVKYENFYNTFAEIKERQLLYLSNKGANLTPQIFNASDVSKEPWSLFYIYFTTLFTHWLCSRRYRFLVKVLSSLQTVFFNYTHLFGYTLSWTARCFSAEAWIDFSDNFYEWLESIFIMARFALFAKFGSFFPRSVTIMAKKLSYVN